MPASERVACETAEINHTPALGSLELRAETGAAAIKRVIAYRMDVEMKKAKRSKFEMAGKMRTGRSALDRLLDPSNAPITLQTLEKEQLSLLVNTSKRELA